MLAAFALLFLLRSTSFVSGQQVAVQNSTFGYTVREPLGVVGCIGAFNFPFQMATWKSGPALACGNAVVFKPSPLTPITAVMLAEVYKEAGLPDGCYNVIQVGEYTRGLVDRALDSRSKGPGFSSQC